MSETSVLEHLAVDYPQLYLNPDTDSQEAYRRVVLRGEESEAKSLAHYRGDPADREELTKTPAGSVRVVTLGNRKDFELALRGLITDGLRNHEQVWKNDESIRICRKPQRKDNRSAWIRRKQPASH